MKISRLVGPRQRARAIDKIVPRVTERLEMVKISFRNCNRDYDCDLRVVMVILPRRRNTKTRLMNGHVEEIWLVASMNQKHGSNARSTMPVPASGEQAAGLGAWAILPLGRAKPR